MTNQPERISAGFHGKTGLKASGRMKYTTLRSWIRKNSVSSEFLRIQLQLFSFRRFP